MKILYIHNEYAAPSGEEHAAKEIARLLTAQGHEVRWYTRSSQEISDSTAGKIKALAAGIYNPFSARRLAEVLDDYRPDIVQVQNLYPLISPSIFRTIRKRGIPVVMRCPNYRLFCPNGLSLNPAGEVCEKCWGGNDANCIQLNCLGSRSKSIGYAIRNAFARKTRMILDGVDAFIVQSRFQKDKFMSQGIPEEKIGILPGLSPQTDETATDRLGDYVGFVGRASAEKGVYELIDAARINPDIPFKVAGNIDSNFRLPDDLPANIEFVGFMKGKDLDEFFLQSRIIAVPSKWYEGFPNVIVMGMLHKKPIITSDIGAMQSIIDHNTDGLLVPPGNSGRLAEEIRTLYFDADRCRRYGDAGFRKATTEYSRKSIYNKLMAIYAKAQANQKQRL